MKLERVGVGKSGAPLPVYEGLVESLLAAHGPKNGERDALVAHVLGTCASYAYGELDTVATISSRLGLEDSACVRITETVDAMLIYSTAYLLQSSCGRVVILCYRGTELTNWGNWLGDADVGADSITLGGESVDVHSGFYRNLRATRWAVMHELNAALHGGSLLDPAQKTAHPMEALYVTGHSLGGAMAVLFAFSAAGFLEYAAIAEKLRAVYTFGQPLTVGEPLPRVAKQVGRKLFRHVLRRDPIPALPPAAWGRLVHVGREYHPDRGDWIEAVKPVAQAEKEGEIVRSVLASIESLRHRAPSGYVFADHSPNHYLAALRPKGRVTEFGDHG